MGFMDQIAGAGGMGPAAPGSQPSQAPQPAQSPATAAPPQPGQMGPTTRPRQRFVDKVLMKQRGKGQQSAEEMLASTMGMGR